MRTTPLRFATHIGMQFKAHWLIQRKVKVPKSIAESILLSKGIKVVEAKDVLRPALIEEPYEPLPSEVNVPEEKPGCYFFTNSFKPIEHLKQCQLLTNSLVFSSLPESILNKVQDPSKEDEEIMKEAILHSHILDAQQVKLPYVLDVVNFPGYHPPRKYGIRTQRKISSLVYNLLLHLNQNNPQTEQKHILEDVASRVTLNHSDKLMHFRHKAKLLLCSRTPLEPVAGPEEVQAKAGTPLPDIFPLSPFINAWSFKHYNLKEGFAIPGGTLAPHTVFVSYEGITFHNILKNPEEFYGMTLLHAFSHAASYAKETNKDLTGDLKNPVTLNAVHTNGQHFHLGRFQLNTLDCTGSTRNFFWYEPWEVMFENVGFDCAKPLSDKVNARPLSLLRAVY